MLIDVSQIPPEGLDVDLPEGELDLGTPGELWAGPATVQAKLHIGRTGRGFLISGAMSGRVALICGRCLEEFPFHAEEQLTLYCAAGPGPAKGEAELGADELDVTYLEEGRIDTDQLLRESLFLDLPVQPLCREECRGLCQRCGANLNEGPCGCGPADGDPRFHVLRTLR